MGFPHRTVSLAWGKTHEIHIVLLLKSPLVPPSPRANSASPAVRKDRWPSMEHLMELLSGESMEYNIIIPFHTRMNIIMV